MVFPSLPVYLDPSSWNQQEDAQQLGNGAIGSIGGGGGELHQLTQGLPLRSEGGSARPGSMADRARLAKLPQPEVALKCPRCDSINTKFCYFNNYSLTQPRHFCKTCRRYWTRGGALRNVPVGGGCRRNKRSTKASGSSKNQAVKGSNSGASSSNSAATAVVGGNITPNLNSTPQLPFMASLHHLAEYGAPTLGLNFPGLQPVDAVEYPIGSNSSSGLEQWRLQQIQQFPFFGAVEPVAAPAPLVQGSYPFEGEGGGVDDITAGFAAQPHMKAYSTGLTSQMASVKMEDNPHFLNLQRSYFSVARNDLNMGNGSGVGGGNSDGGCGGGGGWMMGLSGLSGFNSSSNLL